MNLSKLSASRDNMIDRDKVYQEALQLCMQTGDRFMECLKIVADEYRLTIDDGTSMIPEWLRTFYDDYVEYDEKMRKAGMK